jgi:hypothetical protein
MCSLEIEHGRNQPPILRPAEDDDLPRIGADFRALGLSQHLRYGRWPIHFKTTRLDDFTKNVTDMARRSGQPRFNIDPNVILSVSQTDFSLDLIEGHAQNSDASKTN